MKLLVFLLSTGLGLAAFAAPAASCGCGVKPQSLVQATGVALEVLCPQAERRDLALTHGFQFQGGFARIGFSRGRLTVAPGAPCRLDFLGHEGGAVEIDRALYAWAEARGMTVREGADGGRWAEGEAGRLDWSVDSPPARRVIWTVQAVYSPASI
jgi:hypothetical protein